MLSDGTFDFAMHKNSHEPKHSNSHETISKEVISSPIENDGLTTVEVTKKSKKAPSAN